MAKRPADPILVDLEQFDSLAGALQAIQLDRPVEEVAHKIMASYIERDGEWNLTLAFFQSAVTRGRALREAIVREIEASNPHSVMALLRQLAETVAMVFYIADHPKYAEVLATHPAERKPGAAKRKSPQAFVNYMDQHHSEQFGVVYDNLCEMTHFGTSAMWSPHRNVGEDGTVHLQWQSAPEWKTENDALICCALLLELSNGMNTALIRLGRTLVRIDEGPDAVT